MKVALVHEMLVKMGGAERVLDMFQKIFPLAPIYTLLYDEKKCGKIFLKEKIHVSCIQKWQNFGIPRQFLVTKMSKAIEDFDFSKFDLVISSSSAFAHGIITPSNVKHISYIHAPMRYVWDYAHEYLEEKAPKKGIKKWIIEKITHTLRIWDFASSSRPDLLLANSKTTQKRIEKYWRRESKILYPPVETHRFSLAKRQGDYFLIVSALEPFKKIDLAVDVFSRLPKHKLVIIGEGSQRKYLESIAGENIEFLGKRSDGEVKEYMEHARAFIFPGLEDFGIAPVEAMSAGIPVIAYGKGGVTESVLHQKTGIFFFEQTPASFFSALGEFFEKESFFQKQRKEIRIQAERFSHAVFEKEFYKILEQFLSQTNEKFL